MLGKNFGYYYPACRNEVNTIRNCVLGVYEDAGEYEDRPARLRDEFNEIMERAAEE